MLTRRTSMTIRILFVRFITNGGDAFDFLFFDKQTDFFVKRALLT